MAHWILRRKKLGRTSARTIAELSDGKYQVTLDPSVIADGDSVIRWGCTATIRARELSSELNVPSAIHWAADKARSRMVMQSAGISVPQTTQLYEDVIEWGVRTIVRPRFHAQGKNILMFDPAVDDDAEIELAEYLSEQGYASKFINKDREFRIYVIEGRVVCVAEKFVEDKTQVAWNKALGGSFKNVLWQNWPVSACLEAVKAFHLSGLDFGGVDAIQEGDKPYILEVNSAPSLTSPYRQKCFATALCYEQELPPIPENARSYRDVIHPAICDKAR